MVKAENVDFENSRRIQMEWLRHLGFDVVEYKVVDGDTIGIGSPLVWRAGDEKRSAFRWSGADIG